MIWYKKFNVEYGIESDIHLNEKQVELLLKLFDIHKQQIVSDNSIKYLNEDFYLDGFPYLESEGYLSKWIREDDTVVYGFTEKGLNTVRSLYLRIKANYLPKIDSLISYFIQVRKERGLSRKELSRVSGIKYYRLGVIEERAIDGIFNKKVVYIRELKKIAKALDIHLPSLLKELKKKEIERASVKTEKTKIVKNSFTSDTNKLLISESPIETKLLKEIIKLRDTYEFDIDTQVDFSVNGRNYRAEILIEFTENNQTKRKILIECDGHDFHEKTKEQVQKDKQRDRDFLSAGIITIRFTGSEIWKNATKCAEEIMDTYNGYLSAISI